MPFKMYSSDELQSYCFMKYAQASHSYLKRPQTLHSKFPV